jgi:hypothetical protein
MVEQKLAVLLEHMDLDTILEQNDIDPILILLDLIQAGKLDLDDYFLDDELMLNGEW